MSTTSFPHGDLHTALTLYPTGGRFWSIHPREMFKLVGIRTRHLKPRTTQARQMRMEKEARRTAPIQAPRPLTYNSKHPFKILQRSARQDLQSAPKESLQTGHGTEMIAKPRRPNSMPNNSVEQTASELGLLVPSLRSAAPHIKRSADKRECGTET